MPAITKATASAAITTGTAHRRERVTSSTVPPSPSSWATARRRVVRLRGGAALSSQMGREVGRRHRLAEEVPLAQRAAAVDQEGELLLGLDALGQALQAEVAGEADHRLDQDGGASVAGAVGG